VSPIITKCPTDPYGAAAYLSGASVALDMLKSYSDARIQAEITAPNESERT
jgi:hypothetical protein